MGNTFKKIHDYRIGILIAVGLFIIKVIAFANTGYRFVFDVSVFGKYPLFIALFLLVLVNGIVSYILYKSIFIPWLISFLFNAIGYYFSHYANWFDLENLIRFCVWEVVIFTAGALLTSFAYYIKRVINLHKKGDNLPYSLKSAFKSDVLKRIEKTVIKYRYFILVNLLLELTVIVFPKFLDSGNDFGAVALVILILGGRYFLTGIIAFIRYKKVIVTSVLTFLTMFLFYFTLHLLTGRGLGPAQNNLIISSVAFLITFCAAVFAKFIYWLIKTAKEE